MRSSLVVVTLGAMLGGCGSVKDSANVHTDAGDAGALAASCADLGMTSANQDVMLHLDADAAKPYSAHCGADLKTYLPLKTANVSSYPIGGCATLPTGATAGVTTTWPLVELDPVKHTIVTNNYTYAVSNGTTHELSDNGNENHDYTNIPFASGRSCISGMAQMVATVDLTGTHFAITASQAWAADGFTATVKPMVSADHLKAAVTATGFPIGASPCPPNSDYYTTGGGACLQLDYVP